MVSTAAFHARVRGSVPGFGGLKETKNVKVSIAGSLRDREVACSASDRQGSNCESCVWRTVSSHHPQEVLLAQFSLYVHKGGLKPDLFTLQIICRKCTKNENPRWPPQMSCLDNFSTVCSNLLCDTSFIPYSAGINFSRQILTTKVEPRTVRVDIFLMAVDP